MKILLVKLISNLSQVTLKFLKGLSCWLVMPKDVGVCVATLPFLGMIQINYHVYTVIRVKFWKVCVLPNKGCSWPGTSILHLVWKWLQFHMKWLICWFHIVLDEAALPWLPFIRALSGMIQSQTWSTVYYFNQSSDLYTHPKDLAVLISQIQQ